MFQELVELNKTLKQPLYTQLVNQTIDLIRKGVLKPTAKLPSTRKLAAHFGVHRKTIIMAFDELINQGWLEAVPGKGTFVSAEITSEIKPFAIQTKSQKIYPQIKTPDFLNHKLQLIKSRYHLDDGLPDARLAPIKELNRAYKSVLNSRNIQSVFGYTETLGSERLRKVLVKYLYQTRGMRVSENQILITRGVTQALFLSNTGLLSKGDKVAVPELNWYSANMNFKFNGAELVKIKVDAQGLDVHHLEEICKKQTIKMIYLTPHHHYPTTVIMPAHRRVKLLELCRKYGFYVFEDDYDYDFHFSGNSLMPLSGVESDGLVLYAGSFTKAISPVFRVGYLVGNEAVIDHLSKVRRVVDRQGDALLENALAELLELGIIQRQIRKARKIYEQRRDFLVELLQHHLDNYLNFKIPEGGMSIWTKFDKKIDMKTLAERGLKNDLYFSNGLQHETIENHTRLGFASHNEEELEQAVNILKSII